MQAIIEKAKSIRLFILDVDGVLTPGIIYYGSQGMEMKGFHIHDGLGIKLLQKTGVQVAIISAKKSEPVARRLQDLNIEHAYLGQEEKLPAYEELKQKLQLNDNQIGYMGDDLPDLPLLRRTGLAITVPGAPEIIRQHTDFITKNKGGKGAVREACEFIMKAQGQYQSVIQSYLTK
jgi:3-deoxy-D-manno-octulosonate 8-phosphate phosphatase (KDO 8-P phosphatase)